MDKNNERVVDNKATNKNSALATGAVAVGAVTGGTVAVLGVFAGGAAGTAGGAALTSGLATVGVFLGGGMVAGIVTIAAAPIVGGVAAFGLFNLFKKLSST